MAYAVGCSEIKSIRDGSHLNLSVLVDLTFGRGEQVGKAFESLIPDCSTRSTVKIVEEE